MGPLGFEPNLNGEISRTTPLFLFSSQYYEHSRGPFHTETILGPHELKNREVPFLWGLSAHKRNILGLCPGEADVLQGVFRRGVHYNLA